MKNCALLARWTMRRSSSWQRGRRLRLFFDTLNARLADRQTLPGGFSIADISAVVAVDFARVVRVKPGDEHPHLQRWRAAMAQRPSMAL
jgi:glutathione S-transferase